MTTKINPNHPRVTDSQIYRHASETVRSTSDAGGIVPKECYSGKTSRTQSGGTNQNIPLDQARGDK